MNKVSHCGKGEEEPMQETWGKKSGQDSRPDSRREGELWMTPGFPQGALLNDSMRVKLRKRS